MKMKLVKEVGLVPDHSVLDGDPGPLPLKHTGAKPPKFRPLTVVAKWLDESICHLVGR